MTQKMLNAESPPERLYYEFMRDFGAPWMERIHDNLRQAQREQNGADVWVAHIIATHKAMVAIATSLFAGHVDPDEYETVAQTFGGDISEDLQKTLVSRRELEQAPSPSSQMH